MAADFTYEIQSWETNDDYPVLISEFEDLGEQRRLLNNKKGQTITVVSPPQGSSAIANYVTFFNGKYGSLTSFTIVSPLDGQTYTVRFVQNSFRVRSVSAGMAYVCEFQIKVL